MNKAELLALLTKLDLNPSRKLGQNFLLDPNLLDAMVRLSNPQPGEPILEIGPGTGALTQRLIDSGCNLTAIELDHRLAGFLREHFADKANFRLIEADACKSDIREIMGDAPFRCIANLPYSCSSQLLASLISLDNPPQDIFVLLQKEMADRLAASPNTKDYGVLTVRIGLRYKTAILKNIDPKVFFPPPEVTSAYTRLSKLPEQLPNDVVKMASDIAGLAFAQRRKMSLKLIAAKYGAEATEKAFKAVPVPIDARADAISIPQYTKLAEGILKTTNQNA